VIPSPSIVKAILYVPTGTPTEFQTHCPPLIGRLEPPAMLMALSRACIDRFASALLRINRMGDGSAKDRRRLPEICSTAMVTVCASASSVEPVQTQATVAASQVNGSLGAETRSRPTPRSCALVSTIPEAPKSRRKMERIE